MHYYSGVMPTFGAAPLAAAVLALRLLHASRRSALLYNRLIARVGLQRGIAAAQIYLLLLFLRVLLSWFPAFNWERQPWLALRQVRRVPFPS